MPRVPDGRTVLTEPEALNRCNGPVVATRRHLAAFHTGYEPNREQLRNRQTPHRVTKGAGSKAAALAMAYMLLITAQERWRRFNGHELVAEVLYG